MTESSGEFQDNVMLITGAASGIGAATAIAFARKGAILSLADLNNDGLEQTIHKCQKVVKHLKVSKTIGDLGESSVRTKFVEDSIAAFGKIHVLVNCAGICLKDNIKNYSMEVFDKSLNINTKAPYHLSGLCAPHIMKTKGSIINIASVAPNIVVCNELSYSMSKIAVKHLTKHMAAELGPHGVRVNAISPGVVLTNLHGKPRDVEIAEHSMKHLNNRCQEPEEIAELILFLASNKAAAMIGCNVVFDSGLVIKKLSS